MMNGIADHAALPTTFPNAYPDIKEFFEGRNVFVTGAAGLMGKVLIEKLLRTCGGIKFLYVLLRPKRNKDLKQRTEDLLKAKVFDRLKKERPEALIKMVVICGDIEKDGLNLTEEDEELMTTEVSVVVHLAATTRFDSEFRDIVNINVAGTRRVMDLCSKMRHLTAVVYVSTAFSNCTRSKVEEVVYPLPFNPKKLSESLSWMDDGLISTMVSQLLGGHPTSYTLTKAMAEQLVFEEYSHLPIAIVRPSIVVSSWKEPFPGWVDTFSGNSGYILAVAKGIIRCNMFHVEKLSDVLPVDFGINMMIAIAWYTAVHKSNNVRVYNCISGNQAPVTWGEMHGYMLNCALKYPVSNVLWYPSVMFSRNRFFYHLMYALISIFPLRFLDLLAKLIGKKPMIIPLLKKFDKTYLMIQYFFTHDWKFSNDNVTMVWEAMSPQDRQDFDFDFRFFDWKQFMRIYFDGLKLHLLKDDPSNLPAARRHLCKMYLVYILLRVLGVAIVWKFLVTGWNWYFIF